MTGEDARCPLCGGPPPFTFKDSLNAPASGEPVRELGPYPTGDGDNVQVVAP